MINPRHGSDWRRYSIHRQATFAHNITNNLRPSVVCGCERTGQSCRCQVFYLQVVSVGLIGSPAQWGGGGV